MDMKDVAVGGGFPREDGSLPVIGSGGGAGEDGGPTVVVGARVACPAEHAVGRR